VVTVTLIIAAVAVIIAPFFTVIVIAMWLPFGAKDLGGIILMLVIIFLGVGVSVYSLQQIVDGCWPLAV
jgi:hypothetical protein